MKKRGKTVYIAICWQNEKDERGHVERNRKRDCAVSSTAGEIKIYRRMTQKERLRPSFCRVYCFGKNHETGKLILLMRHGFQSRRQIGMEYLEKRHIYSETGIPQSQFTMEAGYYLKLFSDCGYESINWNNKLLPDGA